MKDIELPPLPDLGSQWTPYWTKVVHKQMQSYARAAVEADRAQRVPDWSHPKVQALIGSDARKRIQIDLLWRILENPNDEFGPSDMEYWDAIHDRLKSALLASTPTPAQGAQRVPDGWKLVPVEPTVEMLDAFRAVDESAMGPCFFDAYRAMLAATPAPAQQEPSEVKGGQLVADPLSRLGENSPGVEAMIIAAVDRVRATEIVSGESPESFRDAIALRVADLAKPTFLATSSAQHQEPPQQERKPMTDAEREQILRKWRGGNWSAGDIMDAVERHHGIKE